jgi:heme-degrading monooxygenase HmoA
MKTQFKIAQVNIARMRAPLDHPLLAEFIARLEDINGLADSSPGFVWRLKTDAGDATSLRPYDDDRVLFNLSVWANPEDLREFVYRSAHAGVMRQRKSWFERFDGMYYALWWVSAGHIPSIPEAKDRLEYLRAHGESARAFSFANLFPAPDSSLDGPVAGFAAPFPAA